MSSDPQVQRVTQEGMMTTSSAVDRSDNVTSGAQRGARLHNLSGHYTDKFDYNNDLIRERSGVFLSSQFFNENAMQPSQEFVSCSSNLYNVNPCIPAGLGGRADIRARGFAREQQVRGLQPGYWGGQSFGGENRNFLLNDNTYQITDTRVARWLSGRASDLRSSSRGFDPGRDAAA